MSGHGVKTQTQSVRKRNGMVESKMQQIIVSGIGGQGVLFVTKLIAEAALREGYSVFISETHGMAQRGGNVISHLKVSSGSKFFSPLIRPGRADLLLALHPDAVKAHGFYLSPEGKCFSNSPNPQRKDEIDATSLAERLGSAVSANLVMLGFAAGSNALFCKPEKIRDILTEAGGKRLDINLKAFQTGWSEVGKRA